MGFAKMGWGVMLAWLTVACETRHVSWISRLDEKFSALMWSSTPLFLLLSSMLHHPPSRRFLGSPPFQVLARLAFMGYLVHMLVLESYFFSFRSPVAYSGSFFFVNFLGLVICVYALAFCGVLLVEMPFAKLEKVVFSRLA
jgi:peptidoglycan/LPS O-acetylase OafA/YrhL